MLKPKLKKMNVFLRGYNLFLSRVMFSILALFVHCVYAAVVVVSICECVCVRK